MQVPHGRVPDDDTHYPHSARYVYRGSVARVDRFEASPRGRSHASGYAVGERLVERHAGLEKNLQPLWNRAEAKVKVEGVETVVASLRGAIAAF